MVTYQHISIARVFDNFRLCAAQEHKSLYQYVHGLAIGLS